VLLNKKLLFYRISRFTDFPPNPYLFVKNGRLELAFCGLAAVIEMQHSLLFIRLQTTNTKTLIPLALKFM